MPSLAELMRVASAPRVHGGIDAVELAALGIDAADVLDVSTSINPYGPDPAVACAAREAVLERYPDPAARAARDALADACQTTAERIVVGNGATDLLWTLARLLLAGGETLLVCEPSFSELRAAAQHGRARIAEWRASAAAGFAIELDALARRAREERARVVSLCVPASPSGAAVAADAIAAFAEGLGDVAIVLDQSFLALSERHAELAVRLPDNVLCVRSLTKEHAIPGVRLGYLVAAPALAGRVEASRPAWTVSASAQAAAVAASRAHGFVAASRTRLLAERTALEQELRALGLRTVPSSTPYFLLEAGDAAELRRRLLVEHRILVRDCTSFGMPRHVRIAARGGAEARRLVAALAAEAGAARHAARRTPGRV